VFQLPTSLSFASRAIAGAAPQFFEVWLRNNVGMWNDQYVLCMMNA
jgi:hypothetical protein